MAKKKQSGLPLAVARLVVFVIWCLILAVYIGAFFKKGEDQNIDPNAAEQGAWTAAYTLLPVIVAFATFYLGPNAKQNLVSDYRKRVGWDQFGIALVVTFLCHGIALFYFYSRVWTGEFNFNTDPQRSFSALADSGFKWLLLCSMGPIIAVNFVLGRTDVNLGKQAAEGDGQ